MTLSLDFPLMYSYSKLIVLFFLFITFYNNSYLTDIYYISGTRISLNFQTVLSSFIGECLQNLLLPFKEDLCEKQSQDEFEVSYGDIACQSKSQLSYF